jgi:hypothetical protein
MIAIGTSRGFQAGIGWCRWYIRTRARIGDYIICGSKKSSNGKKERYGWWSISYHCWTMAVWSSHLKRARKVTTCCRWESPLSGKEKIIHRQQFSALVAIALWVMWACFIGVVWVEWKGIYFYYSTWNFDRRDDDSRQIVVDSGQAVKDDVIPNLGIFVTTVLWCDDAVWSTLMRQ